MAHQAQKDWCLYVKGLHPSYFKKSNVLDFGSLDINGCNRYLFEDCKYTGIDIGIGKNVDVVSNAHEFKTDEIVDVIISTEMFEHDKYIEQSLNNMMSLLRSGGLFLFTCATYGRPEHGTRRTSAADSPFTTLSDDWSDYYRNLGEKDIRSFINIEEMFETFEFSSISSPCDLRFYGIKK